jgi:hypothetical protein
MWKKTGKNVNKKGEKVGAGLFSRNYSQFMSHYTHPVDIKILKNLYLKPYFKFSPYPHP